MSPTIARATLRRERGEQPAPGRVIALCGDGTTIALREPAGLKLLDAESGDRGRIDFAGPAEVLDMVWTGDRLWVCSETSIAVVGKEGETAAARDLPAGRLCPVSGEEPAVVVAGAALRRVRLEGGALVVDELGAAGSGESILASLGGLRTLRAVGDEIQVVDPGRVLHRLRLPGDGAAVAGAEILGGGAVVVARSSEAGLVLDVVRLPGGRVHRLELVGARHIAFAPRRGLALAATDAEIIAADLRYGRVTHRARAPLPGCCVDIDEVGETVAIAACAPGRDRPPVYRVPFADLFSGAALLVPAPEREPPPAPTCRSPVRLLAPQEDNDDPEPEPVPLPSAPLLALTLPTVARAEPPPARSQPYEHPVEHLGELLELARAVAARAIARAWDRGTLRAPIPGARPGEAELEALSGEAAGSARADLASWAGRVRELEAAIEGRVRATASAGDRLPLPELAAQLGLSETAVSVLVAVLAPALCPETARLYAVLADDPARPLCDRALVLELLGGHDWSERERVRAELAPDRPLVAHGAVQVGMPGPGGDLFTALSVNRAVLERLRGELTTSEPAGVTTLVRADGDLEALAIPRPILAQVLEALGRAGGEPPRIVVRGRPGMGRTTLLAAIAARAGRALAVIDAERLPEDDLAGALWRELVGASLRGAVACVSGLEERCRSEVGGVQSAAVRAVVGDFFEPIAFRAGAAGELPLEPGYLSVTLPTPSETERRARWRQATRRRGLRAEGLDDLARRYRCGPGTIERVVAEAGARPPEGDATGALEAAARRHVSCRLGPLATRVERLARLDQVALPPEIVDSIKELIARARHRRTVFETWGFGQVVTTARGLTALFSGPPGTGKTMVAGAIARELGLDLFRVDLARVVSKWIGETEKNLGRLFDAAEDGQAVILFDEADSLFSRRTQVKSSIDRHGNMEVNYLLQRIDAFEGVALLTTNQAGAIDAAFRRRLSLRLAFPYPDEETRVQLWRAHLPEGAPVAGDLDLAALARKFPLTGGTIRNSVLRAAFLAAAEERPLGQEHLLRAVHLEYSDTGKLAPGGRLE